MTSSSAPAVEPLAQHRRGSGGTNLASEFGQGRVPPLPRPLGTLAVHEPPDARLGDPTLTKLVRHVPHEAGIVREAGRRPGSLGTRQLRRRGRLGVEHAPKLHPRNVLVVLREETPEARTQNPHEEPRGVPATDNARMIRGGEEIQPAGLARGDIPRGDRLGVEVEQPCRVAEILRLHISQGGPVGRRFGLLRFRF